MSGLSYALQIGVDILNTVLGASPSSPTGTILAQTGDVLKGSVDSTNSEWWQHVGLASRPSNPVAGQIACQGISLRQADRDVVICSRDVRTNQIYGNLAPGETCIFAAGSDGNAQGRVMLKADGSVTLYTTDDNTPTGQAVYFRIHPTKGLTFVAPWGTFTFDQTGLHVKHQSGFGIDGGSIGGLPAPFSALSSYLTMTAATAKLDGAQIYLGNGPVYGLVTWGLGSNPLTMPGIPIAPSGFEVPCGLFTTARVHVGII
jgi:hypothetical protein